MASTTIQIRIDEKDKKEVKKIFARYGLTISSATRLFLKECIRTKSLAVEGFIKSRK